VARVPGGPESEPSPMSAIAIVLAAALSVGLLLKGSPRRFDGVLVHWWGLALAGLALQVVPVPEIRGVGMAAVGAALLVGSYTLLLAFVSVNKWLPGAGVMALGLLLNLSVVSANAGMPVSPQSIRLAGGAPLVDRTEDLGPKHHVLTDDDVLWPLADVIPIPRTGVAISIGDVLLYGAVGWFVIAVMLGRSRENPRPLAPWFQSYRGKHAPPYWRLPARYRLARPGAPSAAVNSGT
jgi:uncharacterized protein DUF5317